jgi:hypothetical protein
MQRNEGVDGSGSKLSTSSVAASVTWLALSTFFFFEGVHKIRRHEEIGWPICVGFTFVFGLYLHRLVKFGLSARWKNDK